MASQALSRKRLAAACLLIILAGDRVAAVSAVSGVPRLALLVAASHVAPAAGDRGERRVADIHEHVALHVDMRGHQILPRAEPERNASAWMQLSEQRGGSVQKLMLLGNGPEAGPSNYVELVDDDPERGLAEAEKVVGEPDKKCCSDCCSFQWVCQNVIFTIYIAFGLTCLILPWTDFVEGYDLGKWIPLVVFGGGHIYGFYRMHAGKFARGIATMAKTLGDTNAEEIQLLKAKAAATEMELANLQTEMAQMKLLVGTLVGGGGCAEDLSIQVVTSQNQAKFRPANGKAPVEEAAVASVSAP